MNPTVDFGQQTFLDHVSLAARETVYSAAFAWVLGEHSPLPLEQRLRVVAALSGCETAGASSLVATTEWKKVDIRLTMEWEGERLDVLIENKLKSTEGDGQLSRYDKLSAQLPRKVKKLFLTLTGEAPGAPSDWVPVSYTTLLEALSAQPGSWEPPIADLCAALARLIRVSNAARSNERDVVAAAFGDQPALKSNQINQYVARMRLKTLVQRIWMAGVAKRIDVPPKWRCGIGETHGQALLNVEVALSGNAGCAIGLQLQGRNLKAFCAPSPYPRRASEQQHQQVESILGRMHGALKLPAATGLTHARRRGFRSYCVAELPEGRDHEAWAAVVRGPLKELWEAFPSVEPVTGTSPITE